MNRRDLLETHFHAVYSRLQEDEELATSIFDGDVTGGPDRYTNVFHDTGFYSSHTMWDVQSDLEVTFTIHSVGVERWQAVWGSGRVVAQLLDFRPTIDGRSCFRMKHAGGQPVALAGEGEPPKFLAVDRFTLRSIPA